MGRLGRLFLRLYVWACHRLYNEFAWAYDAVSWLVSLGHWDAWRRTALDHVRGPRVLEVGFGTGELLIALARRDDLQVHGLDLSPAMHRVTRRKMRRRGVRAPRVRALVQVAPFRSHSFDSIVSTFPAEYILETASLREFARLLRPPDPTSGRPGGRVVIVGMSIDFNRPRLKAITQLIFGRPTSSYVESYRRRAAQLGLELSVEVHGDASVRVPVLVLEKVAVAAARPRPGP